VLEFRDPLPVLVAFSLEQVAPIQSRPVAPPMPRNFRRRQTSIRTRRARTHEGHQFVDRHPAWTMGELRPG
jgi:hypothetical protein